MEEEDLKDPQQPEAPEAPEIEQPEQPEAEKPPEPEKPDEEKPKADKKVPDWAQKRFRELSQERNDAKAEAEKWRTAAEHALAAKEEGEKPKPDIDALAEQKAQQIAHQRAFDEACNRVYTHGKKDFPDFEQAVQTFGLLGGLSQPFLEAVTELGEGHKVLHHLGQDPDEAARVMRLPPTRMAIELARIEASLAPKPRKVSSAPPPANPLKGKGSAAFDFDDPNAPMDQWASEFLKRLDKR